MFFDAKNKRITIGNIDMDYIVFGKGSENLILIPGLGDGLRTVKGMAVPFAISYGEYAKNYKVYVFSRINQLVKGSSTRDMAQNLKAAMDELYISRAHIMGVSQGGMIAQYLAIDYPELVEKLVLAVTLAQQNETVQKVVGRWITMAESNDYKNIVIDTAESSYSENYLKKYRLLYPLLVRAGRPKDFSRFIIQANSCIHHNAYDELVKITCPTLVIGGDSDKVVGNNSQTIVEKIRNSKLVLYKGLGHGAYEEAKDFKSQVIGFLGLP